MGLFEDYAQMVAGSRIRFRYIRGLPSRKIKRSLRACYNIEYSFMKESVIGEIKKETDGVSYR